jgi:hypothetical protein
VPPLVNLLGDALTLGQMLNPKKSKVPVITGTVGDLAEAAIRSLPA